MNHARGGSCVKGALRSGEITLSLYIILSLWEDLPNNEVLEYKLRMPTFIFSVGETDCLTDNMKN